MTNTEPATEPADTTRSNLEATAQPCAPGATIEIRHVDAPSAVIITMGGVIGRNDAAVLSRQLHTELNAAPSVVVVNLVAVVSCDQVGLEVLAVAGERARDAGIALHVVDPGNLTGSDQQVAQDAWQAPDRGDR